MSSKEFACRDIFAPFTLANQLIEDIKSTSYSCNVSIQSQNNNSLIHITYDGIDQKVIGESDLKVSAKILSFLENANVIKGVEGLKLYPLKSGSKEYSLCAGCGVELNTEINHCYGCGAALCLNCEKLHLCHNCERTYLG